MKLPEGVTETEFLRATEKVIRILARSFVFGYFQLADIKQQATLFAIEAMERYDTSRSLEGFLYTHIKNRLINFRRDKFRRNDTPCKSCHNSIEGETEHPDRQYCDKYKAWLKRNSAKQNIMNPLDITNISDENEPTTRSESTVVENVERSELLALIDMKLDPELRSIYLQMQAGESVPKAKREQVEKAVLDILKDNHECLLN